MLIATKNVLSFGTTDTNKSLTFFENGFIKSIVLVLPDFTTAATCSKIEVMDEDGNIIYANTTGWAENATHLISGVSIPVSHNYKLKMTLNAASGGDHNAVVKTYINTQQ